MAIQSSEVLPDNTLEEFRIEFNKLVTDVSGLSLGNTFDSQIIFEGATDDTFETGISVTDPTADRSIVFPDASGNVLLDSANIALGDNIELQFGTDSDLKIFHNGSNSIIRDNGTGSLFLEGDTVSIRDEASSETMANFVSDGAVTLYHNNVAKLASSAAGIDVTGNFTISASGTVGIPTDTDLLTLTSGVLTVAGEVVATGGITSGSNIVSDTDSTDDLGTTGVRWANLFVDAITATDQITATGFTGTLDGILGSGTAAAATTTTLASTTITASGIIKTDDTTEATSTTDGSLQTDGGLSVAKDVVAGDDVKLLSDAAVLAFGADGDVTLTHVADTGILLNSTMAIQFNDASQSINAPSNAILDINATDEIELNATLVDVNANLDVSGSLTIAGAFTPTSLTSSGILKTDDTTEATSTTDGALQSDGGLSVAKDIVAGNDVKLLSDAAVLSFGANSEVTLTHVHDDGLLLNTDMQLQFRDSAINIRSDADGDLDINADDEIELNSTLIDINGNVEISGTATTTGVHTFTAVPVFPNNTIESADIQADAITGAKIADDAINSEHYTNGSIDTAHIAADQIVASLIADNAIDSEHYTDGSIDRAHLAADIIDGTKIADDAINSEHYAADSIDAEHYAAGSVDATALASNAVTTAKINADAVTGAKIADDAINSEHYTNGSIDTAHIAADQIVASLIADNAIDSEHYTDGSIDTAHIANGAVTQAKMSKAGMVLQVLSANMTAAYTTTSTSVVNPTGLNIAITPSATSSKILVMATVNMAVDGDGGHALGYLLQDSSILVQGDAAGSRPRVHVVQNNFGGNSPPEFTMIALTAPSSTSALTFKVGVESSNGTTVYVNRAVRDNDGGDFDSRSASTITVMEIGG